MNRSQPRSKKREKRRSLERCWMGFIHSLFVLKTVPTTSLCQVTGNDSSRLMYGSPWLYPQICKKLVRKSLIQKHLFYVVDNRASKVGRRGCTQSKYRWGYKLTPYLHRTSPFFKPSANALPGASSSAPHSTGSSTTSSIQRLTSISTFLSYLAFIWKEEQKNALRRGDGSEGKER